jgi:hypothetical protein
MNLLRKYGTIAHTKRPDGSLVHGFGEDDRYPEQKVHNNISSRQAGNESGALLDQLNM